MVNFFKKILGNLGVVLVFLFSSSLVYAEDSAELSISSVKWANYWFWIATLIAVLVGLGVHIWMHKKHMASDVFLPLIPAVIVAISLVYLPHFFSAPNSFNSACFQTITDSDGQVRDSINYANECALSREEVSALGIGSVISVYKGASGAESADRHLSTGIIYFFYFLMISLWVIVFYLLTLFVRRKLKN